MYVNILFYYIIMCIIYIMHNYILLYIIIFYSCITYSTLKWFSTLNPNHVYWELVKGQQRVNHLTRLISPNPIGALWGQDFLSYPHLCLCCSQGINKWRIFSKPCGQSVMQPFPCNHCPLRPTSGDCFKGYYKF